MPQRTHTPETGNLWTPADRQHFIDTSFGKEAATARVVSKPGEVLKGIIRVLGVNYLRPGWKHEETITNDQYYAALVFTHPERPSVSRTTPSPAHLLRDNTFGRIADGWEGLYGWPAAESAIDHELLAAGTNRVCRSKPFFRYHSGLTHDREPTSDYTLYQTGVALAILQLTDINTEIERTMEKRDDFLMTSRGLEPLFKTSGLEEYDRTLAQMRAAVVSDPKPVFS